MAFKVDFKCEHLEQVPLDENTQINFVWVCRKRGDVFYSIMDHCNGCYIFERMLDDLKKAFED